MKDMSYIGIKIDESIRNHIIQFNMEPKIIVIHPKLSKELIEEVNKLITTSVDYGELSNSNNLKFRGIKVLRSEDVTEESINVY